jgi:hypothetical protein
MGPALALGALPEWLGDAADRLVQRGHENYEPAAYPPVR